MGDVIGEDILRNAARVYALGVRYQTAWYDAYDDARKILSDEEFDDEEVSLRLMRDLTRAERDDLVERIGWLLIVTDWTLNRLGADFDGAMRLAEERID